MDKSSQFMSVIMKRLFDLADSLDDNILIQSRLRDLATDIRRWLKFGDFIDATKLAEAMANWDKEKMQVFFEKYLIPTMKETSEMRGS